MTNLARQLLELTYIVIGCQFLHTAYCSYKDKTNPVRFEQLGFGFYWVSVYRWLLSTFCLYWSYRSAISPANSL